MRSGLKQLVLDKAAREKRFIRNVDISQETGLTETTVGKWMKEDEPMKRIEVDSLMVLASWVPCDPRELLIIERVPEKT